VSQTNLYVRLVREANEHNLIEPPGLRRGSTAWMAWRSGYLSALKDIAEGRLKLPNGNHTTPEAA
jgi:hypothetical protein